MLLTTDATVEPGVLDGLLGRALALRNQLSAYDATYVALAEGLGATLLTRDARLARAGGHRARVEVV